MLFTACFIFSFYISVGVSPWGSQEDFTALQRLLRDVWSFCAVWPELCLTWAASVRRADAPALSESADAGPGTLSKPLVIKQIVLTK